MADRGDLEFGPFRLLAGRRELLAHGVPVTLGQRAFDVLLALVRRHGELVTKDELLAEVWPGVVVEENNLQVHVSVLRKAFKSAADGERYLLTVAGRGYRFVAPVRAASAGVSRAPAAFAAADAAHALTVPVLTNLPRPLTSLIGRDDDLAAVKARLREHRLVTLTGAGGVGKTRLAIETGTVLKTSFADGVWFAELAPLTDPQLVLSVIAEVLRHSAGGTKVSTDELIGALADKHLLLIIDNCEHVVTEVRAALPSCCCTSVRAYQSWHPAASRWPYLARMSFACHLCRRRMRPRRSRAPQPALIPRCGCSWSARARSELSSSSTTATP